MRRTEQAQGLRLMKFEEVYGRTRSRLCWARRRRRRSWASRSAPSGAGAIATRRKARRVSTIAAWAASRRGAPRSTKVAQVLALFDTRYWDFTAKHFHEKLVAEHGSKRSYNWVRLTLQAYVGAGELRPGAARTGASVSRRALPGMMVHQDGSRHEWVAGPAGARPDRHHGRRHERDLLGLLRRRRGHDVELPGAFRGDRGARAVLLALCRPGQPLLAHARGRRQGGQGQSDPGGARASAASASS